MCVDSHRCSPARPAWAGPGALGQRGRTRVGMGIGGRVPAAASQFLFLQLPQSPGGGPVLVTSCLALLQLPCLSLVCSWALSNCSSLRSDPVTAPLSSQSPRELCHTALGALFCPLLPLDASPASALPPSSWAPTGQASKPLHGQCLLAAILSLLWMAHS